MTSPFSKPLWPLLASFSWRELRQHPWRNAAAVVSVMLGVALAFSVHLINASALDEFSQAVRSVGGQPDLQLQSTNASEGIPLPLWGRLQQDPDIALASPVLELSTYALPEGGAPADAAASPTPAPRQRVLLRVLGVDPLQVAALAPELLPRPDPAAGGDRLAFFAPDAVFLNPMARQALGAQRVQMQTGLRLRTVQVAGSVQAGARRWR